jgi:isopenicillin N synthase-like dioxygenase
VTPSPTVPVFDLDVATPDELVAGLIGSSCVFLVNHGLADDVLTAMLSTGRAFFALPEAEKAAVQWSGEGPWRGWQPVYAGGPQAMLLERFEVALAPGGADQPLPEWAATFDQWPAEPAGLSEAWSAAYRTLHALASRLTTMIATSLGLPVADLPAWTANQHSNLVVNHYLAQDQPPEPGRVRQRPHTDIGGITLLWNDSSPDGPQGLQARIGLPDGPDQGWVPVRFPPGALLLQAGDLLHVWSRGRIPANDHRVVNPPRVDGVTQVARYSAVFFHHPDVSTWVAPALPEAEAAPDTAALTPTAALTHILSRQQNSTAIDAAAPAAPPVSAELS